VISDLSSAFDVVVIAGSAGAPEAFRSIASQLPAWFPASILVVQHRTVAARDLTVRVLARRSSLPVTLALEGDQLRGGVVYVAPSDRQLVLGPGGTFAALARPIEPGHSADPLLSSVAEQFGPRAIGVVLSGRNDDGAAGVISVKARGGRVIAQDRATSESFTMPAAAIATGCVDLVLPAHRIAHALTSLVLWPGAAELLRVPLPPWAQLEDGVLPGAR
jgi:two-component system chemotaxis response regulator CheB